ncbi:MAG: hypothetical protein ACTHK6_08605, partial [Solirubrobacterales bacterium]
MLRIQSSITCVYLPIEIAGWVVNGSLTELNLSGSWKLAEGKGPRSGAAPFIEVAIGPQHRGPTQHRGGPPPPAPAGSP